jgi:hypothetical protein
MLTPKHFERKFEFFLTHKNTNMRPLGTTDPKYRRHDTEIWSFVQFLLQTGNFLQNLGLTAMDLERKFVFF